VASDGSQTASGARIASVETLHLAHPIAVPTGPASVLNRERHLLLVRVATADGVVGWGETSPLGGVVEAIRDVYAPKLLGRDPLLVGRSWRDRWLEPFESGLATGAIDTALHDLRGKLLGVPVHALYGGALRDRVPVYASGLCYLEGVHPRDQWVAEATGLAAQGFRAIKMRIGRYPPREELPLVAAVREALSPDVKLMVDAWGSYTLSTAIRVGRELERLGLEWYEEPLPQHGYHGYEVLADALDIAVAGGEMLQTPVAFAELFERRAVDIVQPDISLCGGIGELLFVARLAALKGIRTMPHSWNGPVVEAASLHAASLLPDPTLMPGVDAPLLEHDVTDNRFVSGLLREPFQLVDGGYAVPSAPGLGIELDEREIERLRV
jgi:D-galactarolactone cycloisomerase